MIQVVSLALVLLSQSDDPVGEERAELVKLAKAYITRLDPPVALKTLRYVKTYSSRDGGSIVTISFSTIVLSLDRRTKTWVGYTNNSRLTENRGPLPSTIPSIASALAWVEKARIVMQHPYPYVACDYAIPPQVELTNDEAVSYGPYTFGIAVQPIRDGIRYKAARYATFFSDPPGQLAGFTVSSQSLQDPDPKQVRKLSTQEAEAYALDAARKAIPNFDTKSMRKTKPDRMEYVNQKSGKARLAHFFGYRYDPSNVPKDWSNYLIWIDVETGEVLAEDHVFEPPEGIGDPSYKPN